MKLRHEHTHRYPVLELCCGHNRDSSTVFSKLSFQTLLNRHYEKPRYEDKTLLVEKKNKVEPKFVQNYTHDPISKSLRNLQH